MQRNISEALFRSTVVLFSRRFWRLRLRPGSEMPAGPCFIYGNHSNNYDPFMINAFMKWGKSTAGVMTMEYLDNHFLAPLFSSVGILGTRKSVPEPMLIRRIYHLLEQDRAVVIYPEGGRRWHGRPSPWIETTAKLFRRVGVPIYPVLIHGSYVGWPRWARYPRPAKIEIEVRPPIELDRNMPLDLALNALKEPINFDENIVEERLQPSWAFKPAMGLDKLIYRDPHSGESGGLRVTSGDQITSDAGGWTATVLPDSRIRRNDTGDILLTADLYEIVRDMPYDYAADRPVLETRVEATGSVAGEIISERFSTLSLRASHLSLLASNDYHIPIEHVLYTSTERSSKLYLTLTTGYLSLRFKYGGSPLQWHDELKRSAPNIRR